MARMNDELPVHALFCAEEVVANSPECDAYRSPTTSLSKHSSSNDKCRYDSHDVRLLEKRAQVAKQRLRAAQADLLVEELRAEIGSQGSRSSAFEPAATTTEHSS
jgi:hypothetical protein